MIPDQLHPAAKWAAARAIEAKTLRLTKMLLPSAREIFAVRLTTTERRTDTRGRTRTVTITHPWPPLFTLDDIHDRLVAAGLR